MNTEPSPRRNHPADTAREKPIKYLDPETRVSNIKPQQQSHNLPIVQFFNIYTFSGDVGSAPMAFECSCSGDDTTIAAHKQPMEEFLLQSWTVSRV